MRPRVREDVKSVDGVECAKDATCRKRVVRSCMGDDGDQAHTFHDLDPSMKPTRPTSTS